MRFDVFHHSSNDDKAIRLLKKILKNQLQMAKKTDEIKNLLNEQSGIIGNISGDLDRIATQLENHPTEAELDEIAADLRSKNEQLNTLANRNLVAEHPNPETPETPETPQA